MTPYQKHKRKWSDCELCPLSETRTRVVLAKGKLPCDILFCGEAPGVSEDIVGKPFKGPAGHLLDSIIQEAVGSLWTVKGYDLPARIAFTNLVACFPKDALAEGKVEPPRESILACQDRLAEFIALAKPKAIIAVGLLSKKWIPKITDIPFVSITHPAALMRMDHGKRGLATQRATIIISDLFEEVQDANS